MFYQLVGSDTDGWRIVYYTKTSKTLERTIFEVSETLYGSREFAEACARDWLKVLVDAANDIGAGF